MTYEGGTKAEAVRRWQHDALPRISALSHAIGIPMDPATRSGARICLAPRWKPSTRSGMMLENWISNQSLWEK